MKWKIDTLLKAAKYDAGLYLSIMAICSFTAIFHSAGSILNISKPDYSTTKLEIKKDSLIPYTAVDVKPSFPGGDTGLFKYLGNSIRYPVAALRQGHSGTVFISFTVQKTGEISDIVVKKSRIRSQNLVPINVQPHMKVRYENVPEGDKDIEKEALRVVRVMPKWNPGKLQGESVDVGFTLPISFRIQ